MTSETTPSVQSSRKEKVAKIIGWTVVVLLLLAGLAYIGYGMGQEVSPRVSGRVTSIELTTQPADPNEQGDYTVHLVTADGHEIVAPCAESLCYKVHVGDTISTDTASWDHNRLGPIKITSRP
jgi:hypothetical protein